MKKHITYIHTYKTGGRSARKNMSFTHNDWGQRDIINNTIILKIRGVDTIYTAIPTKYQKYLATTILKHANVLDKVNKSLYRSLHNMTPHNTYSITIHVHIITLAEISHAQK